MVEAVVHAVGDRAVVVEAGEDFLDLAHHVVGAGDVEEGFLLAGERGIGQVFGGRGRAHRHGDVAAAVFRAQRRVGVADVLVQRRLQWRIDHPAADLRTGGGQRGDILDIDRRQLVEDPRMQVVVGDEGLECIGGGGEAAGNRDAKPRQVHRSFRRARSSCRRPGRGRSGAGRAATGCSWSRRGRSRQAPCEGRLCESSGVGAPKPLFYNGHPPRLTDDFTMTDIRPVFYVSDGTGITAETIGHSLLTQFTGTRFKTDRLPFVDTPDKALRSRAQDPRGGRGDRVPARSWSIPASMPN